MADFQEALRLEPNESLAYHCRGFAWQSTGDFDKAIADHNEAIRLNPGNAYSHVGVPSPGD